jgi:hypothetical protein
MQTTPFQPAGATCDIHNVCLDLTIRGVYANSASVYSRILSVQLSVVIGEKPRRA